MNSNHFQNNSNDVYSFKDELMSVEKNLVNYNKHIVSLFASLIRTESSILDFGAGAGTLSKIVYSQYDVMPDCVEIDPIFRQSLDSFGFCTYPNLNYVKKNYDLIYTSNVLEHIEDDSKSVKVLSSLLKPGGCLVIYVPAFQILFSKLDFDSGHYRRYSRRGLINLMAGTGLKIIDVKYDDCIGFFLWYATKIKMKLFPEGKQTVSAGMLKLYDRYILPISTFLDKIIMSKLLGKSLCLVASKAEIIRD